MPQTPVKAWRDPMDGQWHRGVEVWRRGFAWALAWLALFGGVLTVRHDWGNNPLSWLAAIWTAAAAFFVLGWARAHRRGWRRGGKR